jgi:hypothetical protein
MENQRDVELFEFYRKVQVSGKFNPLTPEQDGLAQELENICLLEKSGSIYKVEEFHYLAQILSRKRISQRQASCLIREARNHASDYPLSF